MSEFPGVAVALCLAAITVCACSEAEPGPGAEAARKTLQGASSDGLVFARVVGTSIDLARARLADGAVLPLVETPDRDETWPYWSDGAGQLVFQVVMRAEGDEGHAAAVRRSDLVLWNPESGDETPLTASPGRDERWPSWSPDGRSLVFAFRGGRPAAGLAIFDLSSGETRLLSRTTPEKMLLRPSFAPDGQSLSVEQRGPGGSSSQLRVLRLAPGTKARSLTTSDRWLDSKAFFSRNGEEIFFTRRSAGGVGPADIFRIPAAGGEPRPLFESNQHDEHSARPSPVRDEVAFVSNRGEGGRSRSQTDIYLAAGDGSGLRRLTHTPEWNEYAARWSPDGERIVVIASPVEMGQPRMNEPSKLAAVRLRVLDRDGKLYFDAPGMMADWMPAWRQ